MGLLGLSVGRILAARGLLIERRSQQSRELAEWKRAEQKRAERLLAELKPVASALGLRADIGYWCPEYDRDYGDCRWVKVRDPKYRHLLGALKDNNVIVRARFSDDCSELILERLAVYSLSEGAGEIERILSAHIPGTKPTRL
jgi:hypothetical protein